MSNGKMREEFENSPRFKGMDFTRSATHPEYYESPYANGAWDGWQASRESLVIELPYADQEFEYRHGGTTYFDGPEYRAAVFKAVESHGIKVVSP